MAQSIMKVIDVPLVFLPMGNMGIMSMGRVGVGLSMVVWMVGIGGLVVVWRIVVRVGGG